MSADSLLFFKPCETFKKAIDVFVVREKKRREWEKTGERYTLKMGFIIKRRHGVFDYCPIGQVFQGVQGLTCAEMQDITAKLVELNGESKAVA